MASILEHDPVPMSVLQQMTPPALDRVVRTCLAKAPTDRWQTAHDLTLQLKWVAEEGSQVNLPAAAIARSRNRERVIWSLLALSVLGLIVLGIIHFRTPPADAPAVQFSVAAPPDAPFAPANSNAAGQPEVSPDGLHVAFVAYTPGFPSRIWVRSLNSLDAQALPGTEGARDGLSGLFWSPDSRQIGFFAQGKLKRVDYSGGPVLNVCNLSLAGGRGGTWNRDGVIVFGQNSGGLLRVSAAGGEPAPATTLVASEVTHRWPYFLPDGRHFLYTASSNTAFLGSLDSKETRQQLLNTAIKAIYAPPGYLLFGRQGTLMGQAFDTASLELRGEPFTVAQSVLSDNDIAPPSFWTHSVSSTGLLVYRSGSNVGTTRIGWFDRTGKRLDPINQTGDSTNPRLSPDESRIVVVRQDNVSADLWMIDIARGTNSRLTFNPTNEQLPIWSPDGTQIVYTSDQADLYQKTATGSGSEQLLFKSAGFKVPLDWSADGRFLLFRDTDPKTGSDIWVLPMTGERKPTPFLRTPFLESGARFSPDGKWVAYYSSESGSFEIYVQPFPPTGGKWQVSVDGGTSAEWGKDGKELFFVTPDNRLMSVAIESGTQFRAGVPKLLFQVPGLANPSGTPSRFSVTRDGKRFLFVTSVATTAGSPITVLLNWTSALKK